VNALTVHLHHLRTVRGTHARPGYCVRGARAWFAQHQLDWPAFCRHGIDAVTLEATGDAFALAIVAHAREEQAHGR
jgi:hypothetical protein